jgi:hypothetical protein
MQAKDVGVLSPKSFIYLKKILSFPHHAINESEGIQLRAPMIDPDLTLTAFTLVALAQA